MSTELSTQNVITVILEWEKSELLVTDKGWTTDVEASFESEKIENYSWWNV